MKYYVLIELISLFQLFYSTFQEEVRLTDLEPQDAQQIIEQQDTSLKYAPKVDSNVPAVRYIGNEPQNVVEDIYLANQYHGQDGLGGYVYGYSVPDIAKTEKKQAGGSLKGAYNYIAGNGREIKVEYWDDGTGFHQIDNVPKNLPEDLPEVKKAKEEFMRIWLEQAERNSHPVEDPYNSEGQYKEGPLSPQGQAYRHQQFTSQFGQSVGSNFKQDQQQQQQYQGAYQGAQSQQNQRSVYQSNLEKTSQVYNPNYQPYQGRDQQNQGSYQSKQFSSISKGPQTQNYGQTATGVTPQGQIQEQNQGQWNSPASNKSPYQSVQGYKAQYQPQASQNVNQYAQQSQRQGTSYAQSSYGAHSQSGQQGDNDDGQYRGDDEEQQGTPKGFFYKFDYPVGIIVSKKGPAQGGAGYGKHNGGGYGGQQIGGGYGGQQSGSGGYLGQQTGGGYGGQQSGSSGYGQQQKGSYK